MHWVHFMDGETRVTGEPAQGRRAGVAELGLEPRQWEARVGIFLFTTVPYFAHWVFYFFTSA